VKAEVVKGNTRALRFYEKFGFVASEVGAFESASSWLLIKRVDLENP
jgi:ribosomal protein S18 acetylase RimI-like enzyme